MKKKERSTLQWTVHMAADGSNLISLPIILRISIFSDYLIEKRNSLLVGDII